MRFILPVLGVFALAACVPPVPDSAAGVGFSDYQSYMRDREAQLRGQSGGLVPPPQVNSVAPRPDAAAPLAAPGMLGATPPAQGGSAQSIAQEALASIGRAPAETPAPATAPDMGAISDQGFDPAAPRAAASAPAPAPAPQAMQPGLVPERPEGLTNIVEYALRTTNRVGQPMYRRSGLTFQNTARNCAAYANQNLAQEDFLLRGGPQKDPRNIDPDGDGFACHWEPEPFRAAARAAAN